MDFDWLDWMGAACIDCVPDVVASTMTGENMLNVATWLFELQNLIQTGAGYHLDPVQITNCADFLGLDDQLERLDGDSISDLFTTPYLWLSPENLENFQSEHGPDACPLDPFYDDQNVGRF